MSSSSAQPRKRNGMACMHCRQMKLKCDAKQNFPAPCTRCAKFNKSCAINPSFRRTARRQRLDMLENELRQLKENIAEPKQPSSTDDGALSVSPLDESVSPVMSLQDTEPLNQSGDLPDAEDLLMQLQSTGRFYEAQTIEDVTIIPLVICDLFLEFYRYYHPRFPLLPDLKTTIYNCITCPLLFWAIMGIASGRSHTHLDLYLKLIGPIRHLAGTESTAVVPPSLPLIHALLLLCCWPFPFKTMVSDPSWIYCGSATHMALKMGIHRPERLKEFPPWKSQSRDCVLMSSKTWFACFIVNQNLSCQLGIPSTVKVDHSILRAIQETRSSYPRSITDLLHISYKSISFSELLGHYGGSPDGLLPDPIPVIESIESDLNALETANWDSWDLTAKTTFLSNKLHLYSYSLTTTHPSSHSTLPSLPGYKTTYFISQIYTTAIRLIETWCSSVSSSGFDSAIPSHITDIGRSWTVFERNSLIYAVTLLLHLAELSPAAKNGLRDNSITRNNAIRSVLTYVKPHSVQEDDMFARVCEIIEITCSLENDNDGISLENESLSTGQAASVPELRSRMSSNLLYTVARRARMRYNNKTRRDTERNQQQGGPVENSPEANYTPFGELLSPPTHFLDYSLSSLWNSLDFDAADLFAGLSRPDTVV